MLQHTEKRREKKFISEQRSVNEGALRTRTYSPLLFHSPYYHQYESYRERQEREQECTEQMMNAKSFHNNIFIFLLVLEVALGFSFRSGDIRYFARSNQIISSKSHSTLYTRGLIILKGEKEEDKNIEINDKKTEDESVVVDSVVRVDDGGSNLTDRFKYKVGKHCLRKSLINPFHTKLIQKLHVHNHLLKR